MSENVSARDRARQLLGNKLGPQSHVAKASAKIEPIGPGFSEHPGLQQLLSIRSSLVNLGVDNPYFKPWAERDGAQILVDGRWQINFSSYNYLGLANDPELAAAGKMAIDEYGTSVSAARIVSGEIPLYQEIEAEFARYFGTEDAMIFVSGFLTNVSTLGYLFDERDLIVHDSLIHNSMITGAKLAGSKRLSFPHNDAEALDQILRIHRGRHARAVVLTEGVFSMDGDVGNIKDVIEVAHKHGASIMVDEAHSLGTIGETGKGVQEAFGIAPDDVEIWMGSLSKSIGSVGGYIAGTKELIANLRYYAPGAALYCATSPPASAAAALCGLRKMQREPNRSQRLQSNAKYFLQQAQDHGLETGISDGTAVVPIYVGATDSCVRMMGYLNANGINVQAIFYPVVAHDAARLRFFINAEHTREQLDETIEKIVAAKVALKL